MIKLVDLYSLIEKNFVYLMVVADNEEIIYCSPLLKKQQCDDSPGPLANRLDEFLNPDSLVSFRRAIDDVRGGKTGVHALLATPRDDAPSLPMTAAHVDSDEGDLFLFFGAQADGLRKNTSALSPSPSASRTMNRDVVPCTSPLARRARFVKSRTRFMDSGSRPGMRSGR